MGMRPFRTGGGTTLIEMLVYMVLLMVITTILATAISMSLHFGAAIDDSVDAQHNALDALDQTERALASACSSGASVDARNGGISFISAETDSGPFAFDSSGNLLWQRYVTLYVSNHDLIRKDQTFTATSTPPTPVPSSSGMQSNSALTARTLGRDVSAMTFTVGTSSVAVQLTAAAVPTPSATSNSVAMQTQFTFRY
jgi:type II secretory pathway pseudopilin PulG